jgi:AcrR family transcriptional regulator
MAHALLYPSENYCSRTSCVENTMPNLARFVETSLTGDLSHAYSDERRARIIAATIQECAAKGFRGATIVGISKRARVSTASIYVEFATRERLLAETIAFASTIITADLVATVTETEPRARLAALLIRHCATFAHPHAAWLYRAHVSAELSNELKMVQAGIIGRARIEELWHGELTRLHERGVLDIPNMDEAVNFLLGAVQRPTLIAMLMFRGEKISEQDLKTAARTAVDWLFEQFGNPTPLGANQS